MSAPHLSVFLPNDVSGGEVFDRLVSGLSLRIDALPADRTFSFASSAQAGPVTSYVLLEHHVESKEWIDELVQWEHPGKKYKGLLAKCTEHISVTYRDQNKVRSLFRILGAILGSSSSRCVVENGEGCLLTLEDILACTLADPLWRWDKQVFPELPEVGISEWRED